MDRARITFIHALTPLHAGTGQGAGVIDLPIAREKATGFPFLPGSSLKGTLRSHFQGSAEEEQAIFGTDVGHEQTQASCIQMTDQRLLLLPVRTLAGAFAWVTSPFVLRRFLRDLHDTQTTSPNAPLPIPNTEHDCFVIDASNRPQSAVTLMVNSDHCLVLEDLLLNHVEQNKETTTWATWLAGHLYPQQPEWQDHFITHFCILHDDVFRYLSTTAVEITARIKLEAGTKIVQDGGLWYEEALPAESILSGIAFLTNIPRTNLSPDTLYALLEESSQGPIQLGGKATVGRGLCYLSFVGGKHEGDA